MRLASGGGECRENENKETRKQKRISPGTTGTHAALSGCMAVLHRSFRQRRRKTPITALRAYIHTSVF